MVMLAGRKSAFLVQKPYNNSLKTLVYFTPAIRAKYGIGASEMQLVRGRGQNPDAF